MDLNAKTPYERYGGRTIAKVKEYISEIAADKAVRAVDGALEMLIKSGDSTAKITLNITIEEEVCRGVPFLTVTDATKADGKLVRAFESSSLKFNLNTDALPGME